MTNRNSKFVRVSYLLAITCIPLALVMFTQRLFAAPASVSSLSADGVHGITLTVNTTDDELNNDGDCSLREAIQAANTDTAVDLCPAGNGWDTIQVPAGAYQLSLTGADEDANATGDLDILESVNIVGSGSSTTILDGMVSDRVLHADPAEAGIILNLHDVSIINGTSTTGGGIKVNNGAMFIYNSNVAENDARLRGGGIQIEYGSLHIFTSTISNNIAFSGSIGSGGGIHNGMGIVKLVGSDIVSNTASDGGGIYMQNGLVSLDSTKVLSNVAGSPSPLIRQSAATDQPPGSSNNGAGIYANNGQLHIENNSEIAYNQAKDDGGGVYSRVDVLFSMSNSWVHHNKSEANGGGLEILNSAVIKNSIIEHNIAQNEGGGVYHEYDLIVENSTIAHNKAAYGGGFYQYEYGALVISNTVVYSNTADEGGGVYQYAYAGTFVVNSIFNENVATGDGGGIYMYDEGGIYVENSAFLNNRAGEGGAIMMYEEAGLTVDKSSFIGNRASRDGGALYLYDDIASEIRNSTFTENHAGDEGGAFYIISDSVTDIQFTTIVSNSADTNGGGIYSIEPVALQSSIVAGNSVSNSLASLTADCSISTTLRSGKSNLLGSTGGCTATRYDDTVTHTDLFNTVLKPLADNGGPLLPDGSHPKSFALRANGPAVDAAFGLFCLDVDQTGGSRPQGNRCDIGAVESGFMTTVTPPTDHTITVDTTADEMNTNGACSLREAIIAANTDSAVDSCMAGDGWDTIALAVGTYTLTRADAITQSSDSNSFTGDLDITSTITIKGAGAADTIIDGNLTQRVMNIDKGALNLVGVTVQSGNTIPAVVVRSAEPSEALLAQPPGQDKKGGCIINNLGLITLVDSVVSLCRSGGYGGAIFSEEGVTHILNSSITDNFSDSENGGVYNDQGVTTIQNSQIISNSGSSYGGGIMSYYATTRIDNSQILSNTIREGTGGGGIIGEYGNLIIENGTEVRYNSSATDAGGVYADYGALLVRDSFITDNFAKEDGGGIYVYEGGAWIQNSLIANNHSDEDGGGYYGSGYLQNSVIRDNEALTTSTTITTYGGGMRGWGILENILIQNNKAGEGGGIYSEGTFLFNSQILSNSAQTAGGGGFSLDGYGGLFLVDSTINHNRTVSSSHGAGVYVADIDSAIVSRNSTIANNSGAANGGGIYSISAVDLQNTTVSGNAADIGGGIWVSGSLEANFSTIAANHANSTGGGMTNMRAASIYNSIVAGNTADTSTSADCSDTSPITFIGYSIYGDDTGCDADGPNDQRIDAAMIFTTVLKELDDNGGGKATHALPEGSPAIDAASHDGCPQVDQRSVSRPQYDGCDVGAYEKELFILYAPFITRN